MRLALPFLVLAAAAVAGGCGSSTSRPQITIGAARTFTLARFQPSGEVSPGHPTTLAFTVEQPSGQPLTRFKTGPGPHTGVHLIVVRDDLSAIVHRHPKPAPAGRVSQRIDFPKPGRYRVLVDVYPRLSGPLRNFQLHRDVDVAGTQRAQGVPPFRPSLTVDGYRVALERTPRLRALRPAFLGVTVTDPHGGPARLTPWYGALAHAIFFREKTLDYFHTHVCGANTPGCTSILGNPKLASNATRPGRLNVGVLLPAAGTWRMFLQFKSGGRVMTAPFTLEVG